MANELPYFEIRGRGQPALIFVHGLGCSSEDWNAQLTALSARFLCLAIDLPGHGQSSGIAFQGIEGLGKVVNQVRSVIGSRQCMLIGHSLGGKVIREAYLQEPIGVVGLIFIDASVFTGDPACVTNEIEAAINRGGLTAFLRRLFSDMFIPGSPTAFKARILSRALGTSQEVMRGLLLDQISWEAGRGEPALRSIAVPVLALQATRFDSDFKRVGLLPGQTTAFTEGLVRYVRDVDVKVIPNSGHFPMIEAEHVVTGEILGFVARIIRSGMRLGREKV